MFWDLRRFGSIVMFFRSMELRGGIFYVVVVGFSGIFNVKESGRKYASVLWFLVLLRCCKVLTVGISGCGFFWIRSDS